MNNKVIIALGNPGKQYEYTRHNLGWLAIDTLMAPPPDIGGARGGTAWQKHHKANTLVAKLDDTPILKPQTFMNKSGKAVGDYLYFHKIDPKGIIVVHDDIDLEFGTIKIVQNSGAAGHKGVQSIIDELGTKDFTRLRLGIGSPKQGRIPTDKFVLQPFSFMEKRKLKKWLPTIADAIQCLIDEDVERCMNRFH